MSFPNIIYGDFGDEKLAQSTKIGSLPLGEIMVLPDGRTFVHGRAQTSAALSPGLLNVQGSTVPDHGAGTADNLLVSAVSVGDRTITVTAGGTTAITKDFYEDGYLFIRDATGEGIVYKVKSNNSAATGSTCVVTLYENDQVASTVAGGTTTAGLRRNEYADVLTRATGSALVGVNAGVAPVAVSSGFYCWLQKQGPGAGLIAATVAVIGQPVYASTAVAGGVAGHGIADTALAVYNEIDIIGHTMVASTATEYGLINWCIR